MSEVRLDVNHVSFGYQADIPVLRDISFQAKEGEAIGIVGANGVGKSTLLKLIVGLNLGFDGVITVEGMPLEKKTLAQVREKIGYVFQDSDSQLFMSTVYEDVAFSPRSYGLAEEEVEQRVQNALQEVGILHLKDKHIYQMSGGEKKLASIATILSMTPDIILMDEPSVALDPKNRRNLIRILNSLSHVKVIASHDLDMILETCNRTILMKDGKILRDGETGEILTNQGLLEEAGLELPLCLQQRI